MPGKSHSSDDATADSTTKAKSHILKFLTWALIALCIISIVAILPFIKDLGNKQELEWGKMTEDEKQLLIELAYKACSHAFRQEGVHPPREDATMVFPMPRDPNDFDVESAYPCVALMGFSPTIDEEARITRSLTATLDSMGLSFDDHETLKGTYFLSDCELYWSSRDKEDDNKFRVILTITVKKLIKKTIK